MVSVNRYLICSPDHYDVDYEINPWMAGHVHRSCRQRAQEQWEQLVALLEAHAAVERIAPQPGVPDLVFTANAGVVVERQVVLSRFLHPERQREEPLFQRWFEENGFQVHLLPRDLPFEGAGDALLDRQGGWLWAGYGFRSELDSHAYLARWLSIEVLSLRLIDERFYHLDTCFCPLSDGSLLYYPPAFDFYSNQLIEKRVAAEKRLAVAEADALQFACNAVNVDQIVILNRASDGLRQQLEGRGFQVLETPLSEFLKAGGAAKCLTLRLNESLQPVHGVGVGVESRVIRLEGHLLDTGLINLCLDRIVEGGGSFQVLEFHLGEQRQSRSWAQIKVTAPNHGVLEELMAQLIDLGATALPEEERDNPLGDVEQDGVAPDDFYVTTIYPTDVRIGGRWVRVGHQRMDAAIVVATSAEGVEAECRLLRDLKRGDRVVVGVEGLRTVRAPGGTGSPPRRFRLHGLRRIE